MLSEKQFSGFLDTPPLWVNRQFGILQFRFPPINLDSFEIEPVPGRLRLGHQMEHVFKQCIDACPRYKILIHNLPIKRDKRTIGEIDFILRDLETSQVIHVELTYKFYIIDTAISEPIHQLIGPNRRDIFFTKMEKIKQRQFPLLHTAEGQSALAEQGITVADIEHQCCFKGQLFAPYLNREVHIRPLNMNCVQGFWLQFDKFNSEEFHDYRYYIPYKYEWVDAPHPDVQWQSHYEILMEINLRMIRENAPLVWVRKGEGRFEKFFVVWW